MNTLPIDNKHKLRSGYQKVSLLVRGIVSAGFIVYLFTIIDWHTLGATIDFLILPYLTVAPILLMFALFLGAIRWKNLLKSLSIRIGLKKLYAYYLISVFYGIVLPGIIGGDIVRIIMCTRKTGNSFGTISISAIVERICGIIALFVMGSVAIIFMSHSVREAMGIEFLKILPPLTIIGLGVAAFLFLLARRYQNKFPRNQTKNKWIDRFLNLLNVYIKLPYSTIILIFGLSAILQGIDIIASFLIAKALHINLSLYFFFTIMPIVYVSTVLPVSLGGLGIREGTVVYLMTNMNVVESDAVLFSFMLYFNRIVVGFVGGFIHLFSSDKLNKGIKKRGNEPP